MKPYGRIVVCTGKHPQYSRKQSFFFGMAKVNKILFKKEKKQGG